uniref:Zinc finger MYM-type protein 1-like n=1 Tax=Nicotiana tabacum TaxID=4097 RepID=A0A1S4B816_TOBAC|nr:PREDICTED: zinc finger MYM-type protein 1-like [Nicotiana tabacum]
MITKYFKAIPTPQSSGSGSSLPTPSSSPSPIIHDNINPLAGSNKEKILNLNLEPDPAERNFPKRDFGGFMSQFNLEWFNTSYSGWLEYSVKVDAAFCLCCYFFKNEHGGHGKVGNSFTKSGFRIWNKATERLNAYIGEVNSLHNRCFKMMRDLINQEQSILISLDKQSKKIKSDYRVLLNASIDVARFLLKQGMSFRGHDEGETSTKRENFVELLQWYADRDDEVKKVVLQSAPQNNMMIAPNIQKEIVNACAKEIIKAIVDDLNRDYFEILVDESKDVSHKEQMALVLRYVNKKGKLIERFLSIVHVKKTTSSSLQKAINDLFLEHSLSPSQIRGQAVAKKYYDVDHFFDIVANVFNIIGSSFKRRDMLREDQAKQLEELQVLGEVHTGSGLNQELGLQRPGDTRWGSHFKTVCNFIALFSSIINVLEFLASEGANYLERSVTKSLVNDIRSFEFVHMMHLMLKLLAIINELNIALQRKDQDIVNAMKLVGFAKRQLQVMREFKWESLIDNASSFCSKHDIVIPEMDKNYHLGKSKLNSNLLLGIASLSPDNSFANYDKDRIMKLATLYPHEFSGSKLEDLSYELDNYILFVKEDNDFSNL